MAKSRTLKKQKTFPKKSKSIKNTNNNLPNKNKFFYEKNSKENFLLTDEMNNNNFNINFPLYNQNINSNTFYNDNFNEQFSKIYNSEIFLSNNFKLDNSQICLDINPINNNQKMDSIKNEEVHDKCGFHCNICSKIFKRKEYLKKHLFYTHSNYKSMNCIFCGKNIIRITDHIKNCQLKFQINMIKSSNKLNKAQENDNIFKIQTFTELFNIHSETSKKIEEFFLTSNNEPSINIKTLFII